MKIYVEGNIGTGKTTLLDILKTYFPNKNIRVIYEPVDEWKLIKDENGVNLLDKFYGDQQKWSFAFQMNSFISRIHRVIDQCGDDNTINIIERSIFTDKYCFAENCYESGKMDKVEYDIYCRWHDWLQTAFDVQPTGYIYLKTDPKISGERILKRSRDEEGGIPIEYLTTLHDKHNKWMDREKENGIPVLELDLSVDYDKNPQYKLELIQQIKEFIETLG
jgi:deoxyadenosine/deoxycytidine kinase